MGRTRLFPVADVLLAAAYSDRPASHGELDAVRKLLCTRLSVTELPQRLEERIAAFDPQARRDLTAIVNELSDDAEVGRTSMVELTRAVCEADGSLDLREDEFMLALALALSLDPKEVAHVVYDTPFRGYRRVLKRLEDVLLGAMFFAILARHQDHLPDGVREEGPPKRLLRRKGAHRFAVGTPLTDA